MHTKQFDCLEYGYGFGIKTAAKANSAITYVPAAAAGYQAAANVAS